jgi:hypothetical protein
VFGAFKAAVVEALSPALSERGFRFHAPSWRFVRKPAKGLTHALHLLFTESDPFLRVDVHISERIDRVEDIFHRTSGYEKKYQAATPTMGGALDAITDRPELKMLLDEKRGPERARSLVVSPPMLEFYEDWFQRFSDLANIDRELNDDPARETPNRPMPWLRCSTGIIVARLTHRPDYQQLAEADTAMLREFSNGFYLPRFERLLADLARPDFDRQETPQ